MESIDEILKQLAAIGKKKSALTPWEKTFIFGEEGKEGINSRAEKWGDRLALSEKQAAVIQKIFDKLMEDKTEKPNKKSKADPKPDALTANPFPVAAGNFESDEIPST
jgi:hypothetical protein